MEVEFSIGFFFDYNLSWGLEGFFSWRSCKSRDRDRGEQKTNPRRFFFFVCYDLDPRGLGVVHSADHHILLLGNRRPLLLSPKNRNRYTSTTIDIITEPLTVRNKFFMIISLAQ